MIVPTDPIVSGQTTPIKLAVPVGSPFPATPPKPVRPAALTPQIVALRASLPVPVEYNRRIPAARRRWRVSLSSVGRAASRTAGVLRRHRQSAGLVMTAILLGISLTTIVILADAPESDATAQKAEKPATLAAAPAVPPAQGAPAGIAEESDALAGVRIVDPSWDKKMSCSEGTWPYIDQRCLVKDEARSEARAENKIGPRMIGSTPRPPAPETSGPIGSTTAIVRAAPKVNATDGVAARDADVDEDMESEQVPNATPAPPPDVAPSKLVETQTSTMPAQPVAPQYASPSSRSVRSSQRRQSLRTFRLSEETEAKPAVAPRRTTNVRRTTTRAATVTRKRQPYMADAGRRVRQRVVRQAQVPQAPQFFFPFGWFVQAR
ncbi:hypothetical protein CAK95_07125 [Pseudorhodoplanes sinuspersici]|uniref:Uncharacterized protein n=2 Tax=Pseudorhodoplanes sinuspersici TaxID=1235591 RepID=A0A1W6ZQ18_9HYPH|nr:hypothetical protein CAK95_07125 [Pseudorhodoplanes sinuspersici]